MPGRPNAALTALRARAISAGPSASMSCIVMPLESNRAVPDHTRSVTRCVTRVAHRQQARMQAGAPRDGERSVDRRGATRLFMIDPAIKRKDAIDCPAV